MRARTRMAALVAVAGLVAFSAVASGSPVAALGERADRIDRADQGERAAAAKERKRMNHGIVHSETIVQTDEGTFVTKIVDAGVVSAVDGNTVTIERADGVSVTVTATDETKIRRNGEEATTADLRTGDHAMIMQVVEDGTTTVRFIRAGDEEFKAERTENREKRRAEMEERRDKSRAEMEKRRAEMEERRDKRRAEMEERRAEMEKRRDEMRERPGEPDPGPEEASFSG